MVIMMPVVVMVISLTVVVELLYVVVPAVVLGKGDGGNGSRRGDRSADDGDER